MLKAFYICFLLLYFLLGIIYPADKIHKSSAEKTAVHLFKSITGTHKEIKSIFRFDTNYSSVWITQFKNSGFIIIPEYKNIYPLIAFSKTGILNPHNIPDEIEFFLKEFKSNTEKNLEIWEDIENKNLSELASLNKYEYLISEKWHQNEPYNNDCPYACSSPTAVGCVPLSAAVIMNHYKWPPKGSGKKRVQWNDPCGENNIDLIYNFGNQTYSWYDNMDSIFVSSPEELKEAAAQICYNAAFALSADFGNQSTSAYTYNLHDALTEHFSFITPFNRNRNDFKESEWIQMIRNNIDNERPVIYSGSRTAKSEVGHTFLLDGYQVIDYQFFVHFNFGLHHPDHYLPDMWVNIDEDNYLYTNNQSALFDIVPDRPENALPIDYYEDFELSEIGQLPINIGAENNGLNTNIQTKNLSYYFKTISTGTENKAIGAETVFNPVNPEKAEAWFIIKKIDLGYTDPLLKFDYEITKFNYQLTSKDSFAVEVSEDRHNWENVFTVTNTAIFPGFASNTVDLSQYNGKKVNIRFRGKAGNNFAVNKPITYKVDNIAVLKKGEVSSVQFRDINGVQADSIEMGKKYRISWSPTYLINSVDIILKKNNDYIYSIITDFQDDDEYIWEVPFDEELISGSNYTLIIRDHTAFDIRSSLNRPLKISSFIEILKPDENSIIYPGRVNEIEWSCNFYYTVSILLLNNNFSAKIIDFNDSQGTRKYLWNTPADFPADSLYDIWIHKIDEENVSDTTDFPFVIGDYYNLIFPEGNEELIPEHQYNIRWECNNQDSIKLDLLLEDSAAANICNQEENTNEYIWNCPLSRDIPGGEEYKIIINNHIENEVTADSSEVFSIRKKIRLTEPSDGGYTAYGDTVHMEWLDNFDDSLKIEIVNISENSSFLIYESVYNSGDTFLVVPESLPAGTGYYIKISSVSEPEVYGLSPVPFIIESRLEILYPNGEEIFNPDTSVTVLWDSNFSNHIAIGLEDQENNYYIIEEDIKNTHIYSWDNLWSFNPGSYKLKIEELVKGVSPAYDYSDSFFTLLGDIKITSHISGDSLMPDEVSIIEWMSNIDDSVEIFLLISDNEVMTISESMSNNFVYEYQMPYDLSYSDSVRIVVSHLNINKGDTTDYLIIPKYVKMIKPIAGEEYNPFDTCKIEWKSNIDSLVLEVKSYNNSQYSENVNDSGRVDFPVELELIPGELEIFFYERYNYDFYSSVSVNINPYLRISEDTLTCLYHENSDTLEVTSNFWWNSQMSSEWFDLDTEEGIHSISSEINIEENLSDSMREGRIYFLNSKELEDSIVVIQNYNRDFIVEEVIPADFSLKIWHWEDIHFSAEVYDPDNDEIYIHWFLNDSLHSESTEFDFSADTSFIGNNTVKLNISDINNRSDTTIIWNITVNPDMIEFLEISEPVFSEILPGEQSVSELIIYNSFRDSLKINSLIIADDYFNFNFKDRDTGYLGETFIAGEDSFSVEIIFSPIEEGIFESVLSIYSESFSVSPVNTGFLGVSTSGSGFSCGGKITYYSDDSVISGVETELVIGDELYSEESNSEGIFLFNNLEEGEGLLEVDFNEDSISGINALDYIMVKKIILGILEIEDGSGVFTASDVNGDGGLNALDYIGIKKRILGITDSFPVGSWIFDYDETIVIDSVFQFIEIRGVKAGDADGSWTQDKKKMIFPRNLNKTMK